MATPLTFDGPPSLLPMPARSSLKIARMPAEAAREAGWEAERADDPVVMMVDDEPLNLEVLQTFLEEAGYRTAILRDQAGSDPDTGIALLRSYAIALGSDDAAKKEVADAVEEVRNATAAQTQDIDTGIPDAQAIRVDIRQGTVEGAVIFVTFPVGSEVYGIQAVATTAGALDQDAILGAARDLANSVGATP